MSSPPFTVKAVFEYASDHDDDLPFPIGQIVTVTAIEDDEWYYGEYPDDSGSKVEGIFPKNFVEKYDPPAPPRPNRPARPSKMEPEVVAPPEPAAPVPVDTSPVEQPQQQPEPELDDTPAPAAVQEPLAPAPVPQSPQSPPPQTVTSPVVEAPRSPPKPAQAPAPSPPAATEPAPKPAAKPPPPATAQKPTSSSFKDRIAAFNKPTEAPITPLKPGGLSSQSFVKKPFVAGPPSRNAYVPPAPPREPPARVYRREEDPEFQEQTAREPPVSESRPPPPPPMNESAEEGAEDQPKPTSLKDRIALLQQRQAEQASRHAEAAQKKEKPKKPAKPEPEERAPAEESVPEGVETAEAGRDQDKVSSPTMAQEPASDANDADHSAAADTEDTEETSASKEEHDDHARPTSRRQPPAQQPEQEDEGKEGEAADEGEEGEEEEMDPEVKRKMELRERMAKMSGGMGMMGLFGAPGAMPVPGAGPGPRKPKPSVDIDRKPTDDSETTSPPPAAAPPVPVMALPGMNAKKPAPAPPSDVEKEEEVPQPPHVAEQRSAEEVPDVEEVVHEEPSQPTSERPPPPVPPHGMDQNPTNPTPSSFHKLITIIVQNAQRLRLRLWKPDQFRRQSLKSNDPDPRRCQVVSSKESKSSLGSRKFPGINPFKTARPIPPPTSADPGDESDDELSVHARNLSLNAVAADRPAPPPPSGAPPLPDHLDSRRASTYDSSSPKSPTLASEKRLSRQPPPVPTSPPSSPPTQTRAPPPPPPGNIRRRSTAGSRTSTTSPPRQAGEGVEGEITEYDGDYDTDIASGVKHKDALKGHGADSSVDEGTPTDENSLQSPRSPRDSRVPPPLPQSAAPRAVPPPPPSGPPKSGRPSIDTPRGPPPPPPTAPPARESSFGNDDDDEYDPFRYTNPQHGLPAPAAPPIPVGRPPQQPVQPAGDEQDELYDASPVTASSDRPFSPSQEKRMSGVAPLPPQSQPPTGPPPSSSRSNRASLDVPRSQHGSRRSVDVPRPSVDQGFIATDVDLAEHTVWWSQPNTPPPALKNRNDVLYEIEESSSSKRGGKASNTKDVYVLFMDYSQTVITVNYDARNPTDASLEQRQEPPAHQPRQDQLENAHVQIGSKINNAVTAIQNTTVADGTPFGLVQHLLNPLSDALLPVGTRTYGALVYTNLANASVQQFDEIRAGDIVSFRNARFQGHRGTMHQKYSAEVGKPDHVGVVVDWDGTKKKIRAWEQGRESKKVKMESFRLSDLRSGECKVWRVMPRRWVGWEN